MPHDYSPFSQSIRKYKAYWKAKAQTEETEQESEPESNIIGMLELSDQEFFKMVINMLRDLT